MDFKLFDLIFNDRKSGYEEYQPDKWQKIKEKQLLCENALGDKNDIVRDFEFSLNNYLDDYWINECDYYLKYGVALGMEIQKFISKLEDY